MLEKTHEGQPGQFPYVSLALSSNSLHQSVPTGLCMSAPHRDTLKHLGRYITCVVVFADFNRLGLLLPVYRHPSGKPSPLSGLRTGTGTLLVPCGGGWLQFNVMPRTCSFYCILFESTH